MCDAPLTLINATFDWLSTHFSDQVDFIVWTGDSVRHDLDENLPRSLVFISPVLSFVSVVSNYLTRD